MSRYLKTLWLYAITTLRRSLRDPLTTIILFGIPTFLLLIFGFFLGNERDINIRTVLINRSSEQLAVKFEQTLREIEILKIAEDKLELEQAREKVRDGELDTIIELPDGFGQIADQTGQPTGKIIIHSSQGNPQIGQVVDSLIKGVAEEFNRQLIGVPLPLSISTNSVDGVDTRPIDHIFPLFTGLALMMVGVLGIASVMPTDRKMQVFRRLKITPIDRSQIIVGTGLSFLMFGLASSTAMIAVSMAVFDMQLSLKEFANLIAFIAIGLVSMIGLGLAIGSWAKNPTQGEAVGQIVFMASMGLSGVWIPVAMMPEYIQTLTAFMPLTPIIDGLRFVVVNGSSLIDLLPQLAVISVWATVGYAVSYKLFRWE